MCPVDVCTINCKVGAWSLFGNCSKPCGTGTKRRTRPLFTTPGGGGAKCPPFEELRNCNPEPCSYDCKVSAWAAWGACKVVGREAGECSKTRSRTIVRQPGGGGGGCPVLMQEQNCDCDDVAGIAQSTPWYGDLYGQWRWLVPIVCGVGILLCLLGCLCRRRCRSTTGGSGPGTSAKTRGISLQDQSHRSVSTQTAADVPLLPGSREPTAVEGPKYYSLPALVPASALGSSGQQHLSGTPSSTPTGFSRGPGGSWGVRSEPVVYYSPVPTTEPLYWGPPPTVDNQRVVNGNSIMY